jgi:hypothetical protein
MSDERLAAIKRRMGNLRLETFTQAEMQYLFDRIEDLSKYVDELEMIIYHSVRLSDIMREGDSEKTYLRIKERIDKSIADAWQRLSDGKQAGEGE